MGSSRACSRVTFETQLQTAARMCEYQQGENKSHFPTPCKPSHPGMTLFQLINTVFLEMCSAQLIHSPFCQSSSCPRVTDNARPQQENHRNSALEEGPEHRQPKEWIYLMPCKENISYTQRKASQLDSPRQGTKTLFLGMPLCPCYI